MSWLQVASDVSLHQILITLDFNRPIIQVVQKYYKSALHSWYCMQPFIAGWQQP
jgi:hypothetical protein